jgi:hypothetical protein
MHLLLKWLLIDFVLGLCVALGQVIYMALTAEKKRTLAEMDT